MSSRSIVILMVFLNVPWGVANGAADRIDEATDSLLTEIDADASVGLSAGVVSVVEDAGADRSPFVRHASAYVLGGVRQSTDVRIRFGSVSGRARHVPDKSTGWLVFSRSGWLEQVIVGGVGMSVGNGLALGARRSPFSLPTRPSAGAVRVSPSASLWRRRTGAAATVNLAGIRLSAVTWRGDDSGRWYALDRRRPRTTFGVAGGVATHPRAAQSSRGATGFAGWSSDDVSVRAEAGVWDRRAVASVRIATGRRTRWASEFGLSPAGGSLGDVVASPASSGDYVRAAIRRSGVLGRMRHDVRAWSVMDRSSKRLRRTDRIELRLRGPAGAGRIDLDARGTRVRTAGYSSHVAATRPLVSSDFDGRFRLRYESSARGVLAQRAGLWLLHSEHGVGVVSEWRISLRGRAGDLTMQAVVGALQAGQLAVISRPGLARSESLGVLTGNEADLSARARLRWRAVTAAVYAGGSTGQPVRTLFFLGMQR